MNVHSLTTFSTEDLSARLDELIERHFQPTLAIVFISIKVDAAAVGHELSARDIQYLGCTTAGEIYDGQVFENSISLLLFDLSPDYFRVINAIESNTSLHAKVAEMAGQIQQTFADPATILLAGGVGVNGDEILGGFRTVFDEQQLSLFGGLAGDDLFLEKTQVFANARYTIDGLTALVLDQAHVEVSGMASSGWAAIGIPHTITAAEGNVVHAIDEKPALDVFIDYFGFFDNANLKGKPISTISAQYPLQLIRPDGSHILRSPLMGNEDDGSLVLAGGVETGMQFQFSISPGFEVIDQIVAEFGEYHQRQAEAEAVIMFSCVGRFAAFGPLIQDEVRQIYDHWKVPMAGFFSYGEFGNTRNGNCDFHNETCSLVTLKERKKLPAN